MNGSIKLWAEDSRQQHIRLHILGIAEQRGIETGSVWQTMACWVDPCTCTQLRGWHRHSGLNYPAAGRGCWCLPADGVWCLFYGQRSRQQAEPSQVIRWPEACKSARNETHINSVLLQLLPHLTKQTCVVFHIAPISNAQPTLRHIFD